VKDADFDINLPQWCCYCIAVKRSVYANDPDSYTSHSVASGWACLAGQVKGRCQMKTPCRVRATEMAAAPPPPPQSGNDSARGISLTISVHALLSQCYLPYISNFPYHMWATLGSPSYSGRPVFRSWPRNQLPWLRSFIVFQVDARIVCQITL
jgi:hypothetical protein